MERSICIQQHYYKRRSRRKNTERVSFKTILGFLIVFGLLAFFFSFFLFLCVFFFLRPQSSCFFGSSFPSNSHCFPFLPRSTTIDSANNSRSSLKNFNARAHAIWYRWFLIFFLRLIDVIIIIIINLRWHLLCVASKNLVVRLESQTLDIHFIYPSCMWITVNC